MDLVKDLPVVTRSDVQNEFSTRRLATRGLWLNSKIGLMSAAVASDVLCSIEHGRRANSSIVFSSLHLVALPEAFRMVTKG